MSFLEKKVFQYLCPPGNGVFTVHTARENKEVLHEKLYGTIDSEVVHEKWKESLVDIDSIDHPFLLGVTLDTGGGIQRGANWGPLFIRNQLNASARPYTDLGDTKTIPHLLHDKYLNQQTLADCRKALYTKDNALPVSALSITEDFCEDFYELYPDKKIIGLGGDHSVSYSLVKPWLQIKKKQNIKTAIIHFDAHTDLMQNRLGIDICFASWAYHMLEHLEKPSHLIQLGIRSSGQNKDYWQRELGVQQFWSQEILAPNNIGDQICEYLNNESIQEVYISFDIDALDAKYASCTGTPESGGLAPHHCIQIINQISQVVKVTGADLVEVAPFVASSHASPLTPEPETTLNSAKIILQKFLEVMN